MSSPQPYVFFWEPKSESQRQAQSLFDKSRILFLLGSAGCGKTFAALALALRAYTRDPRQVERIYLTRPMVAAGEELGFLPGDLHEKVQPWLAPFDQALSRLVHGKLPPNLLEPAPLGLLRGWTFYNSIAILDESQNCTIAQLKLFISRMGKGSRLIICGDPEQSDIEPSPRHDYLTDLDFVADRLSDHPSVSVVDFPPGDNLRDPLLTGLLRLLS